MLVFDITNEKSFENIKNWIRNIEEVVVRNCNIYISVGEQKLVKLKALHCSINTMDDLSSLPVQHASADVEKMVLGNKCDVNDKRQVSKDRGEKVGDR